MSKTVVPMIHVPSVRATIEWYESNRLRRGRDSRRGGGGRIEPHDMFYGMRELIIRDINRFWITFGKESA